MCLSLAVLSSGHITSTGRGMNPAGSTLQRRCFALSLLAAEEGQPGLRVRCRTRGMRDEDTNSPNVTWQGCADQSIYSSLSCAKSAANWALLFCVSLLTFWNTRVPCSAVPAWFLLEKSRSQARTVTLTCSALACAPVPTLLPGSVNLLICNSAKRGMAVRAADLIRPHFGEDLWDTLEMWLFIHRPDDPLFILTFRVSHCHAECCENHNPVGSASSSTSAWRQA